jgi:hypothetical protein
MADVINLRRVRNAKARAEKARQAAENRVRFGRTKDERERATAIADLDRRRLDQAKRDPSDGSQS